MAPAHFLSVHLTHGKPLHPCTTQQGCRPRHLSEPCCSPIAFPPAHRSTAPLARPGHAPLQEEVLHSPLTGAPILTTGFSQILPPPPPTGLEVTSLLIPEKHKTSQHRIMQLKTCLQGAIRNHEHKAKQQGQKAEHQQRQAAAQPPPFSARGSLPGCWWQSPAQSPAGPSGPGLILDELLGGSTALGLQLHYGVLGGGSPALR